MRAAHHCIRESDHREQQHTHTHRPGHANEWLHVAVAMEEEAEEPIPGNSLSLIITAH